MEQTILDFIKSGDAPNLKTLLENDPILADGKTDQGISFLQLSAYYRNGEVTELIRAKKKNIDLFEACCIGDIENVKNSLDIQPKLINTFSNDGFTPLGLACFFGHFEIVKYLVERGAEVNIPSSNSFKVAPIHSATAISNYEITELLIKNGADVNAKQQSGVTPLHSAAHNGKIEITKLLVKHGADVNAKTVDGKTPLDMAEEKSFTEAANFIRECIGQQ
jgi:ankyrin repeat protein